MDIQRELKNDLTSITGVIETQDGIYIPLKEVERLLINRIKRQSLHIDGAANSLFDINTVLHTKDGRKIGNAIITGKDDKYNIIKTDYGNECKFTDEEIKKHFHIAYSRLTNEERQCMRDMIGEHRHSV